MEIYCSTRDIQQTNSINTIKQIPLKQLICNKRKSKTTCSLCDRKLCYRLVNWKLMKCCPMEYGMKFIPTSRLDVIHTELTPDQINQWSTELVNKKRTQCDYCGKTKIDRKINGQHCFECPNVLKIKKMTEYNEFLSYHPFI